MSLHSLDPREKVKNVTVFYSDDNKCWYFRRYMDTVPTGHYETEAKALRAARKLTGLDYVHTAPCEKFEGIPGRDECLVCFWPEAPHTKEAA